MPLSPETKINLINTDTRYYATLNQAPMPEDDRIVSHLSHNYDEYFKLRSDARIHARLQKRISSLLGREVILDREPAEKAGKPKTVINRGEKAATAILNKINYESICNSFLSDGQLIGFACQQVDYEEKDGLILPTLNYIPPYRIHFAAPEPSDRTIPTATGETLDPETEIAMVRGYELRLLTKEQPISGVRMPKERIVCYCFGGHTPWGLGLGYQTYGWWLVKNEARNAWLLMCDRLGSPPVLGTHSAEADLDNPESKRAIRQWKSFLQSISPNGWVDMPEGFKAELLETISSLSPDAQKQLIQQANQEISEAILGDITFAEKDTGSYAANESQVEDLAANLTDGDCNVLDEQLQEFWSRLLELNGADRDSIIVRRKTVADRRKEESEKRQQDDDESQAKQFKYMADAGFVPAPEYVQTLFKGNWTFHGPPQLISGFPQQPYPDGVKVEGEAIDMKELDFGSAIDHILKWNELDIGVEYLPGQTRFKGKKHARKLTMGYGHIRNYVDHEGDKEALDIYLPATLISGEDTDWQIFQIDQLAPEDGDFDEHKLVLAKTIGKAKAAYLKEMPAEFFGGIRELERHDLEDYRKKRDFAESVEVEGEVLADADWETLSQISASDWIRAVGAIVSQGG